MSILERNRIWSLTLCLNLLKVFGFLVPGVFSSIQRLYLMAYGVFWWFFLSGSYTLVQTGNLFQVWGDLTLMISTSFTMFTNLASSMKIINVIIRGKSIQAIVDEGDEELDANSSPEGLQIIKSCDRETSRQLYVYYFLSIFTVLGLVVSADKNSLPLRIWYPYDTSKSPAYELTYIHQITALVIGASVNASMDTLVTSLIAVSRCRLRLLDISLRNLCSGVTDRNTCELQTRHQDEIVVSRLKAVVRRHQAVLRAMDEIPKLFGEPILAQFTVSMVIICVIAYQMAVELHSTPINVMKIGVMMAYLLCMMLQIFLYCYQGNQLSIESSELVSAAYDCPWYLCSLRFRRALLVIMVRSDRDAKLIACGFTTLSLDCFTAIIKASYSFFTVLQRVGDQ